MRLAIARCPKCSCEFALSREVMDEMVELTCPRCERVFEPLDEDLDGDYQLGTDEREPLEEVIDGEAGEEYGSDDGEDDGDEQNVKAEDEQRD